MLTRPARNSSAENRFVTRCLPPSPRRNKSLADGKRGGLGRCDRARSSAVEHTLHTGGVTGSIPVAPTRKLRKSIICGPATLATSRTRDKRNHIGTTSYWPQGGRSSRICSRRLRPRLRCRETCHSTGRPTNSRPVTHSGWHHCFVPIMFLYARPGQHTRDLYPAPWDVKEIPGGSSRLPRTCPPCDFARLSPSQRFSLSPGTSVSPRGAARREYRLKPVNCSVV